MTEPDFSHNYKHRKSGHILFLNPNFSFISTIRFPSYYQNKWKREWEYRQVLAEAQAVGQNWKLEEKPKFMRY